MATSLPIDSISSTNTQSPVKKRPQACTYCRAKKIRCAGGSPCSNCYDHGQICVYPPRHGRRQKSKHAEAPMIRGNSLTDGAHDTTQDHLHRAQQRDDEQAATFDGSMEDEEGTSLYTATGSNLEYQGPRSSLSICSKPGIAWVNNKVGSKRFDTVAQNLSRGITHRLKMDKQISSGRNPEPEPADAWRFTEAYFEQASDATLGIVHRPWFEAKLRLHFSDPNTNQDVSWYALRNIVFAYGCRIEMAKSRSFVEAAEAAWSLFANSLSVHTELLYWHGTVLGVQALTIMAYYTEAISSPTLQYMLSSCAMRLACAKGMHRQPAPSWEIPEEAQSLRSCTFWALYCLDKQITSRSGRPSAIEDDEISCRVPGQLPSGSTTNWKFFIAVIKLSQLSSSATKRLSNAKAIRQPIEEVIKIVSELSDELQQQREHIQQDLDFDVPFDLEKVPPGLTLVQALVIQYTYYTLVFDIHTAITHPWSRGIPQLSKLPHFVPTLSHSSRVVAQTCRAAILDSRFVPLDAASPILLAFQVPLHSVVNLFIYILRNLEDESITSDLNLLDVGAGFFARLDFATASDTSISFAKEVAELARSAVQNFKAGYMPSTVPSSGITSGQSAPESAPNVTRQTLISQPPVDPQPFDDAFQWYEEMFDDDIAAWSAMLDFNTDGDLEATVQYQ